MSLELIIHQLFICKITTGITFHMKNNNTEQSLNEIHDCKLVELV